MPETTAPPLSLTIKNQKVNCHKYFVTVPHERALSTALSSFILKRMKIQSTSGERTDRDVELTFVIPDEEKNHFWEGIELFCKAHDLPMPNFRQ